MNERIQELADQVGATHKQNLGVYQFYADELEKFAESIVQECIEQVEQAKNSPFVSLDDSKRMSHFVDVTKKKIKQQFGVKE